MNIAIFIIVEGKNDRRRIRPLLEEEVQILCTFGTLNNLKLDQLHKQVKEEEVYLFMDNDASGKRIRAILRDAFPDSIQIYTRRGYAGVEGTPVEYIVTQLEKAGLEQYIIYPKPTLYEQEVKL